MEQYISKSAAVGKIKRRIASLESIGSENYLHDNCPEQYAMLVTLKSLKFDIDTLEVKEVDLESEIKGWLSNGDITDTRYDDYDDGDIERTAKHFFELGMSVSNKPQKGE